MNDLIREAIKLLPVEHHLRWRDHKDNMFLDALAAQLVRQVEEQGYRIWVHTGNAQVFNEHYVLITYIDGPDRAMNTIKAIVESGVLEPYLESDDDPCKGSFRLDAK